MNKPKSRRLEKASSNMETKIKRRKERGVVTKITLKKTVAVDVYP
jgi:hypothetical protein